MTRDQLADELLEIRRCVRTDVEHVSREAWKILDDGGCAEMMQVRLRRNVMLGLHYIQVDPEILEGYLYAAAFELRLNGKEKPC